MTQPPVAVEGTLSLDGPAGRLKVVGRGERIELQVIRLRGVPSLIREYRRGPVPGSPHAILARLLHAADLTIEVVRGRWRPLDLVPVRSDDRAGDAVRLRPRFHVTRWAKTPGRSA